MDTKRQPQRTLALLAVLVVSVLAAQGCGAGNGSTSRSPGEEKPHSGTPEVLAFDKTGVKPNGTDPRSVSHF